MQIFDGGVHAFLCIKADSEHFSVEPFVMR
jgi:hypothetical protein